MNFFGKQNIFMIQRITQGWHQFVYLINLVGLALSSIPYAHKKFPKCKSYFSLKMVKIREKNVLGKKIKIQLSFIQTKIKNRDGVHFKPKYH